MNISRLRSVAAILLTIALLATIALPANAQALQTGWNSATALCPGGYFQTGPDTFGATGWFSVTPDRVGVVTAGFISGYQASGPVKVTLNTVGDYNFEIVSGAVCIGPPQPVNAWLRQTCPQCVEGVLQETASPPPAQESAAAPAEPALASQFVAVGGIMLNRDLNECYTEPTGVGATVTKTWNVQPGRTLYAFAWSINGSTRPAWVSVPGTTNGMVSLTVTDGIVVVCSSPLAFTPEAFDGFTEMKLDATGQVDGGHLLGEQPEVIDAFVADAGGNAVLAQINWVKAHNQVLIDELKVAAVAAVQRAPAPVATPLAPQTVASTFFPERKTTGAGARLDFTKGMPVLGAFIQFKSGGTRELCRYDAAPEDGFVISGVIGTPFEGEKLKPCGG